MLQGALWMVISGNATKTLESHLFFRQLLDRMHHIVKQTVLKASQKSFEQDDVVQSPP